MPRRRFFATYEASTRMTKGFPETADAALRASERKYRTLFQAMGQGYDECELIRDPMGRPVDYRILEVNPAFERLLGMSARDICGRRVREIIPDLEDWWPEEIGRIVDGGLPGRIEHEVATFGRFYDVTIYPGRGDRFAALFDDITERKRAEAALRDSEERQAFLLKLSDALRPLADPSEVKELASRLLGEHLGIDRAAYAEFSPDGETVFTEGGYCRAGIASVDGSYKTADFKAFVEALRCGETAVVRDASDESSEPSSTLVNMLGLLGIRAAIASPFIKASKLVAAFYIHSIPPRHWTDAEVALVRHVAERTWEAAERARAEAALRENEMQFRGLLNASNEVLYRQNASWSEMLQLRGGGFLADTDAPDPHWLDRYIHPDDQPHVRAMIQDAIRTKSVFELEHRVVRSDGTLGWTLSRSTPLLDADGELVGWFGAASDVTARKEAEQALRASEERQAFLLLLSDALRPLNDPVAIQDTAMRVLGTSMKVNRAFYADAEDDGDTLSIGPGYSHDISPLVGRIRFSDFELDMAAWYRAGRTYVIEDLSRDPRFGEQTKATFDAIGVGAAVGVPLVKDGRVRAIVSIHQSTPRRWTDAEKALLEETAERTWSAVERARAETAQGESQKRLQVLVAELQHRTRNLMGVVRSMSDATMRASDDLEDFEGKFRDRLAALSRVQGLLSRLAETDRITFDELLRTELTAHGALGHAEHRVFLKGPASVALRSSTVQTLAMALHELSTNAIKYGALGAAGGRLAVEWRLEKGDDGVSPLLHIDWRERGVDIAPPDAARPNGGQGRELIEKALPYQLKAKTSFVLERTGLHCTIVMPVSERTVSGAG